MKRNSTILILILAGLAGLLVVCVLAGGALIALFRISTVSGSNGGTPAVVTEVVEVLPGGTQSPVEAGIPESGEEPTATGVLPESGAVTPEPGDGVVAPAGWNAFLYEAGHFAFTYPAKWGDTQQYNEYTHLFFETSPQPLGVGPLPKLVMNYIPLDDSLAEGSYNFMSHESIRTFLALPVGDTQLIVPDAIPAEYFTYTRLPDRMVGGWQAMVIENESVWEAPEEITDRRALIVTEAGTIILGTYYATAEELALFEQVLDSFQFLPD